jgi:hypothetical protein
MCVCQTKDNKYTSILFLCVFVKDKLRMTFLFLNVITQNKKTENIEKLYLLFFQKIMLTVIGFEVL